MEAFGPRGGDFGGGEYEKILDVGGDEEDAYVRRGEITIFVLAVGDIMDWEYVGVELCYTKNHVSISDHNCLLQTSGHEC